MTQALYVLDRIPNAQWKLLTDEKRDWEIDFLQRHVLSGIDVAQKMQTDSRPSFDEFGNGQYSFVTLYKFYRMVISNNRRHNR